MGHARPSTAAMPAALTAAALAPHSQPPPHQEDWKFGGHKSACPAFVLAAATQAQLHRLCKAAAEADKCMICLEDALVDPARLPCGHTFCGPCVVELRARGVSESCPLCRSPLPPGPEKLFELGYRVWLKIFCPYRAMDLKGVWPTLMASQQREMDGVIVMLQEATDQVSLQLGCVRWAHHFTACVHPPWYTGPHQCSGGHRLHLLLWPRRDGRLHASGGGVQGRCRGG